MTRTSGAGESQSTSGASSPDKNGDGVLDREEWEAAFPDKNFDEYDLNGDGQVTKGEINTRESVKIMEKVFFNNMIEDAKGNLSKSKLPE